LLLQNGRFDKISVNEINFVLLRVAIRAKRGKKKKPVQKYKIF